MSCPNRSLHLVLERVDYTRYYDIIMKKHFYIKICCIDVLHEMDMNEMITIIITCLVCKQKNVKYERNPHNTFCIVANSVYSCYVKSMIHVLIATFTVTTIMRRYKLEFFFLLQSINN